MPKFFIPFQFHSCTKYLISCVHILFLSILTLSMSSCSTRHFYNFYRVNTGKGISLNEVAFIKDPPGSKGKVEKISNHRKRILYDASHPKTSAPGCDVNRPLYFEVLPGTYTVQLNEVIYTCNGVRYNPLKYYCRSTDPFQVEGAGKKETIYREVSVNAQSGHIYDVLSVEYQGRTLLQTLTRSKNRVFKNDRKNCVIR